MERYGGVNARSEKLKDFTPCLIYWACQNGITVNLSDLALHTLMSVNEYASKILSGGGETVKPQSLADIVNERRKGKNKI